MRTRTVCIVHSHLQPGSVQRCSHITSNHISASQRALQHPSTHPHMKHTCAQTTYTGAGGSAQYIQVHRRGLGQALEHAVDFLDVQPHVGFPLPAPQHQVVYFLRTGAGPLQDSTLCDTLNHLQGTARYYTVSDLSIDKIK